MKPLIDLREFKKDLGELTKEQFVSEHISDRLPFVFDNSWKDFREWTTQAATLLDVDSKNVTVVGSAACGVSLNPYKNFKLFDGSSDVDVAVISTYHFDLAWRLLRRTNLSEAVSYTHLTLPTTSRV